MREMQGRSSQEDILILGIAPGVKKQVLYIVGEKYKLVIAF